MMEAANAKSAESETEKKIGEVILQLAQETEYLALKERMRHHRSPYSSQGSDDGYEEGRRHRHRRNRDVNDPASAEGFTVIFNKARDEKKMQLASLEFEGYALVWWTCVQCLRL